MSQITESARGQTCTACIPGVCNGDTSTTVLAHIRSIAYGAGTGIKPPDIFGLYACSACHAVIDGRVKTDHDRDFIRLRALEGHMRTLYLLHRQGVI